MVTDVYFTAPRQANETHVPTGGELTIPLQINGKATPVQNTPKSIVRAPHARTCRYCTLRCSTCILRSRKTRVSSTFKIT
ncbi:MAG: hypothetical protein AAF449_02980 [Myxococcota bacterium]